MSPMGLILARRFGIPFAAVMVFAAGAPGQTVEPASFQPQKSVVWNGDLTIPAHLIPLRDENDEPIIPTETDPLPFSSRQTCGPCHDYKTIQGGWHFGAMTAAASGRPGEPWFEVDSKTGTILPLSYRAWPRTFDPAAVGLSPWDFTLLFGRHTPGGGPADPSRKEDLTDPEARWSVSGRAEVNCLACHNRSGRQDPSEWAKQILRENLRWAATAAGGIGEVGGMASRLKGTWDVYDGPDLDDREWAVAPSVKYRTSDFDSKHRYFFDLNYQPSDERCLACHSVSAKDEVRWNADADVHTAAGLKCTDCHRNDLGHLIVRGYEGEAEETGNRTAASFTCRGCHLGEDAAGAGSILPGRLGAPLPKHTGIPLVHFKRLSCTVCHSGPKPKDGLTRVRTSRANRLGITGAATWSTDTPAVIEPVYMKDERRKISPQRLVWPAFWGRRVDKDVVPLGPAQVLAAAGETLKPEERIARVLIALTQVMTEEETPVLVTADFVFAPNVDGGLDASKRTGSPSAVPTGWGIQRGREILPLVPDYDPAAENKDPAIETRFQEFLQAFGTIVGKPGEPAVVVRKTLYRIIGGYLDISEAPAGLAGAIGPGWIIEGKFVPFVTDFDVRTAAAKAGTEQTLTEEQITRVLAALTKTGPDADHIYISGGRLFRLDKGGRLISRKSETAGPVTWPLAHNVRPAQQSLGRGGCTDCHSGGSDFFFAKLKASGPLLTESVEKRSAASFMGLGGLFQRIFGLTFLGRPLFKLVVGLCVFVAGALLLLAGLIALGRFAGFMEKR